ncbi:MAG TPA: hypothetical protein VFE15_11530 [Marmoricola sp.]|jgi:hypothetical protein|nr:hypothetical protein [Marmoricola sp.]
MRTLVGVVILGAVLTVTGCGGSDKPSPSPQAPASSATAVVKPKALPPTQPSPGPRPTLTQLTAALRASTNAQTKKRYTPRQAGCIATVLLATNLSDGALNALAANIGTYVPSTVDTTTFASVIPKVVACSK